MICMIKEMNYIRASVTKKSLLDAGFLKGRLFIRCSTGQTLMDELSC